MVCQESDRELRKMRRHLRDEELRILRGEQQVDENHIDDPVESDAGVPVVAAVCQWTLILIPRL